jgi:mono/diheme cytochrome c family protein
MDNARPQSSSSPPSASSVSLHSGSSLRPQSALIRRSAFSPRAALILGLLPLLAGCEWFTDFKRQPSLQTWQVVIDSTHPSRTNPTHSVPMDGMTVTAFQVSYAQLPGTVDSMSAIPNPVASDQRSLANGHRYYQINCAVCHGNTGAGDGPAVQFGMVGINVVGDITRARSDGYLWGIIRNGRGLMPNYNRIEERDRWDVVNYVRALQQELPGLAVGPIAPPGVTGVAVPGATRLGPTRPVYHWAHPGRPEGAREPAVRGDTVGPTGLAPDEVAGPLPAPTRAVPAAPPAPQPGREPTQQTPPSAPPADTGVRQ